MTTRSLIALGIGQCINWGALYYAFAVLVVPLQQELGVETWIVPGAFSLALLMSAALAPAVGTWGDRDRGPLVMQIGGGGAAALLAVWTLLPGVEMLYLVWAGLGLCMAATLYEPAFVIVGRAYDNPAARLRALAVITIFGGLASTVFLPVTAFLVTTFGWRGAVVGLAIVLAGSTLFTRQFVFRRLAARPSGTTISTPGLVGPQETARFRFFVVAGIFTLATLAGSPAILLALSLALHAAGLSLVAFGPATPIIAAGTTALALGNGLITLVRPHLIQTMFSTESAGILNGRIARQQQLARAGGPIVVAWLASRFNYAAVLALFAITFVVAALIALSTHTLTRRTMTEGTNTQPTGPVSTPNACCGGPAPQDTNACCARDAKAKSAGAAGCGCRSVPAQPAKKTACCG